MEKCDAEPAKSIYSPECFNLLVIRMVSLDLGGRLLVSKTPKHLLATPILKCKVSRKGLLSTKTLSFAHLIEKVCHFSQSRPANSLETDILFVKDCGDTSLPSVSSSFLIPNKWAIKSQSLQRSSKSSIVVLDSLRLLQSKSLRISVLVKNITYEKRVSVRYTMDEWATFKDGNASFQSPMDHMASSAYDRFILTIDLNKEELGLENNAKMEFSIRYEAEGSVYWANNEEENYKVCFNWI